MIYAIDLFCGIGGFSSGCEESGIPVLIAVDNNAICLGIHRRHFPKTSHLKMELGSDSIKNTITAICDQLTVPLCTFIDGENILHIHASPPCQNLSYAKRHRDRDVNEGMRLVLWTLEFLKDFERIVPSLSWSMEQVNNKFLAATLARDGYRPKMIKMNDFGVPQTRIRLILLKHSPAIDLMGPSDVDWKDVVTVPEGAVYASCGSICDKRVREKSTRLRSKKKIASTRHFYTVTTGRLRWLDENLYSIRLFDINELLALQTFPIDYLNGNDTKKGLWQQFIANAVPPKFAFALCTALRKYYATTQGYIDPHH